MWYFTRKLSADQRPILQMGESQEAAAAQRQMLLDTFPDAELGEVFEESADYQNTFPHAIGCVANADGSEDLLWSDGQRTPRL